MRVFLNGNSYELEGGVTRTALPEWADNIRFDGQQLRKDRRYLSAWSFDNWANGLGIKRWNVNATARQNGLWDVDNCDTRDLSQVVLSPAFNTCTIVPSRGDLKLAFTWRAQFYFAETERVATTPAGYAYQFTAPFTIGSRSQIASCAGGDIGSLRAIEAVGDSLFLIGFRGASGNTHNLFSIPTLGGPLTGIPTHTTGNNPNFTKILNVGGTLHILDNDAEGAKLWLVPASYGSCTPVATMPDTVGSYLASLVSDGVSCFAQLPDGIYDFDATPAKIIDTSRSRDLNCVLDMYQNQVFFKNYKSWVRYDGAVLTAAGYDMKDGLPADKMGEITAAVSNWKYTYAAVKGASYSHILTRDGGGVWQYYAKVPTMGIWVKDLILSSTPDGIDRLWCIFGNYGYPGYFLNPIINPLQAGTYSYVPTGEFAPPIYDGGLPEQKGGFYHLAVSGRSNSVKGIRCYYGLDTADPVTTLGDVASHSQAFVMGSPAGLEAHSIQPKFMLFSDSQGTTPEFFNSVVNYLKKPSVREQFDFTIDIKKTSDVLKGARPVEAIIGSLNYERGLRTLMPFWYGYTGTRHVSIIDIPASEETPDAKIREGEREGLVRVRAIEMTI